MRKDSYHKYVVTFSAACQLLQWQCRSDFVLKRSFCQAVQVNSELRPGPTADQLLFKDGHMSDTWHIGVASCSNHYDIV